MVDTVEEQAALCRAIWNPSFSGMAIVSEDYRFIRLSPQFCEITKTTAAEFIGRSLLDILPPESRELDKKNMELMRNRLLESYILQAGYQMPTGISIPVVQIMTPAFCLTDGRFLFFALTIMERGEDTPSNAQCPERLYLWSWIDKKKTFWAIMAGLSALAAQVIEKLLR